MKKSLALVAVISFLSIAVLSIFAMHHSHCLAELAAGASCPESGPLAIVGFHFNVVRGFSTATVGAPLAVTMVFLALAAFTALGLFKKFGGDPVPAFTSFSKRHPASSSPLKLRISRWFALHEKRDPAQLFLF